MKRIVPLALVLVLVLASAVQAAPLPGSGTRSWWELTLRFFGLKPEPSIPIPPDNKDDAVTPPRPGDNKGRLHIPGGRMEEETENDQEIAKHRLSIPGG